MTACVGGKKELLSPKVLIIILQKYKTTEISDLTAITYRTAVIWILTNHLFKKDKQLQRLNDICSDLNLIKYKKLKIYFNMSDKMSIFCISDSFWASVKALMCQKS